ncbi:TetR/AcrR family transcriptional regulator [Streptomyces sp. NBC_01022]|uniref:TetR/AcrR family transcriptional regulator n=1 Tax=Streptomyces sp. NBC_01022 TaxID=2903723 RepID=UPI002DD80875|nr:TetR/AcrR family transcriptional regulator [Streptomyces sp. NBC_01022]WRZ78980.1 TetR/AcrR family transcriptional regulator [Streptomyces sp. NBC_01022]WRZ86699.1 TetR/AcrR family transcriptional regulator [Streptomyces sp. NBC_01022]
MSGSTTAKPPSRGRIDKRQAILSGAFTVFARRGYARACVVEIAEVAGVAKHTVYNHLGDKESLFRSAMETAADEVAARTLAVVELLSVDAGAPPRNGSPAKDLSAPLEDLAYRLLLRCGDEQSTALRRLLHAEIARFPELLDIALGPRANRAAEVLADRLARLALSGRLRHCDPEEAAEQFLALLTGPFESRSRFGTRAVPDTELRGLARSAVRTFLAAYGASATGPAS